MKQKKDEIASCKTIETESIDVRNSLETLLQTALTAEYFKDVYKSHRDTSI